MRADPLNCKESKMTTYSVKCGMRPSSGFASCTDVSTIFRTVIVEAKDAAEARCEAIDECYRQWGNGIEHVKPIYGCEEVL
jgi:hypothetical protein